MLTEINGFCLKLLNILYRQMMFPESIPLFLIVLVFSSSTDSTKPLINVPEPEQTKSEGSCVTISCTYDPGQDETLKLLWFKNPVYDQKEKCFIGSIVYSNTDDRPQSAGYSSRVEYITDKTENPTNSWLKCDLRINDLQKTDSGYYGFRIIGSDTHKYISTNISLTVTDNPCKVNIDSSEMKYSVKESDEFTVRCSTSFSCSSHPEWILHKPGQEPERVTSSNNRFTRDKEEKEGKKITRLKFNPTWEDDNMILSCRPEKNQDSCLTRNITLSVEYAPKEVKATVSSYNVKEGDSVTLSCTSRGRPNPSISWFKEEKEISQLDEGKLINVNPENSGQYYCKAENKHGKAESNKISINVKYGPKEVSVTPDVNINDLKEGDKLKLTCSVGDSNPGVNWFQWHRDYSQFWQQTQTFTISGVTPEHKGSYYCKAGNGIKTKQSNGLYVSVKYSPRQIKIVGESVKVGSRLHLTCSADANPSPSSYTWKHKPAVMSETSPLTFPITSNVLNIDSVTTEHSGMYTCYVSNGIGRKAESINVDVLYPPSTPELTIQSIVREYDVIAIICKVQSFPESQLTVTGPSDLKNIPTSRMNSTESKNMLKIYLNITESDAGVYRCTAKNTEGTKNIEKQLQVLHAPKNVNVSSDGDQTIGHKLTLTCNSRYNPTSSSYEWKKLINGELKTVGKSQELHFHSLNISDSGQYICVAGNNIGKAESPPVYIKVKYIQKVTIIHNMTAQRNWEHPVYLICNADAHPPPKVFKWYRLENKTVLSNHQNFTVLPQNPGMYYCTATNDVGTSQSQPITLFVHSRLTLFLVIFSIILLLILIALALFLIRREIIKARLDQQNGADNPLHFIPMFLSRSSTVTNLLLLGSQNNTRENLSMTGISDPNHGRTVYSEIALHSQDPARTQVPGARPVSNNQKQKVAKVKQGNPKKQDNGDNNSLNYATLEFMGKNEPAKGASENTGLAVYAKVEKKKQTKNTEPEQDYENVSSACAPKLQFNNFDWESDTSEEDDINYTIVSCRAKPGLRGPKPEQESDSSTSSDEDSTVYSAIKK
ncbi:B-cell receptor CD22 isoform X2 [Misgurnus anguillicaudatus]|uniref:B-cell receptor CD22 isoform X2 n=1 Tax=Misgurnus anguillicaudatus TaxID=75329 RepID=UPI003CCF3E4E